MAGNQVMPRNIGSWIITDNEAFTWPLTGLPQSGAWQVEGYNTDIYDHTIYVTYLLDQITSTAPASQGQAANQASTAILQASGVIGG